MACQSKKKKRVLINHLLLQPSNFPFLLSSLLKRFSMFDNFFDNFKFHYSLLQWLPERLAAFCGILRFSLQTSNGTFLAFATKQAAKKKLVFAVKAAADNLVKIMTPF